MIRIILLLAVWLTVHSQSTLAEKPIRLMANISPPYVDQNLPNQGLALELVENAFSRTDYSPEFTIERWSRAMEGVRVGLYDALATAWRTEERDQDFLFSEPYLDSRLVILKLRASPGYYRSLESLAGRRLGVRADYAYGIDFSAISGLRLVEENHMIQNLLNLLNGKVDFVIGDLRTINLQLTEFLADKKTKFEVVNIDLPTRARHVAAGRSVQGHEQLIAEFNRALAKTRKDGSYDAIIKKWDERYPGIK
ncbi:MAG: transporter substrate-binding domain-containing protein [Halioglobus sp.]